MHAEVVFRGSIFLTLRFTFCCRLSGKMAAEFALLLQMSVFHLVLQLWLLLAAACGGLGIQMLMELGDIW